MANPQTWFNDGSGTLKRFNEIHFNQNGTLRELQELWFNDGVKNRLIFRKGLPVDGYTSHYDASQDTITRDSNGNVAQIMDLKKNSPHNLATSSTVVVPNISKLWHMTSGSGTNRHWTVPSGIEPARGGTVKFNSDKLTATIIVAVKMGDRAVSLGDLFFDSFYFNQSGVYSYNASDYYSYTGKTIAAFEFRTRVLPISDTATKRFVHFVGNGTNYVDVTSNFLSSGNPRFVTIAMKVSSENAKVLFKNTLSGNATIVPAFARVAGTKDLKFTDVRIFDWWGGGVESLAGNFYEGAIWPTNLSDAECIEVMDYMIDKWT